MPNFKSQIKNQILKFKQSAANKLAVYSELKTVKCKLQSGFTLMELMVVVTILALIAAILILNINAGRSARNLTFAENLLVSNIRKVQSYSLSGRNVVSGITADYYIMKFDFQNHPNFYTIEAIYNITSAGGPQSAVVETVQLPPGISFLPTGQISRPTGLSPATYTPSCALLAYKLPFGQVLMNDGCQPFRVANGGDYQKVVNFTINTNNLSVSSDSIMTITLQNDQNQTKTITIYGTTGRVDFQ